MNGFGTIDKKDINVLISSIENRINFIRNDINQNVTSLKNQLNACTEELNRLKKLVIQVTNYNDSEYKKLENRINQFDSDIEDIKNKLNTIQYNEIASGKCASGINEYPIYAKYAENDTNGNIISEYYAAKYDLSNVSSTLSADYTRKIAESSSGGMSALSSVSAQLVDSIENEVQERKSKDDGLEMSINNERIDRITKDNELEERIETEKSSIDEAISEIQQSLKKEETRATGAEESIKNDLSKEIEVRTNAITELEGKIKEEETRAIEAEQALQTSIVNETKNREQAIGQLQETITNEINVKINELSGVVETGFDRLDDIDTELSGHIDYVSAGVTTLSSDLYKNYYTKTEVYNKAEVDEAISNFGGFEVHQSLDDIIVKKTNVIYLIGPAGLEPDLYKEYIYTSKDEFILIGDTTVDLSNYYQKGDVDAFVNNLNVAIENEKTRATTKENELDTNINIVSSSLTTQLEETSGTLNENIINVSSVFDDTIEELSSTIDEGFYTTNDYLNDLSSTTNQKISTVNDSIVDLYNTKQDKLTNTQLISISSVPELNQETDYLKVSLDKNGQIISGGMIGNHNINSENAGKVLRINTEGTDLELIRITGGLSYNKIDSSGWSDDVRVNVDLNTFNDCGTIPSNVKNIDFLFDKPIDPQAMPNGIIHFELPSDATLLAVNVYYKVNDGEYIECNYSYLNSKDYKYPIYFNPKHIYQITLNNHNAAFFDFSDNVTEKKNYIQQWYLDNNSKILHHFPTDDPEVFNITSGSPYDDVGFRNKIELITTEEKFNYNIINESAGFSNFIENIDIKTIYQTTNDVASSMYASAGFDNKIEHINRLEKYQYNVSNEGYSVSNELTDLNKQTLFRYLSEAISDTNNSFSNELVDLKITQVEIEGYTREG